MYSLMRGVSISNGNLRPSSSWPSRAAIPRWRSTPEAAGRECQLAAALALCCQATRSFPAHRAADGVSELPKEIRT